MEISTSLRKSYVGVSDIARSRRLRKKCGNIGRGRAYQPVPHGRIRSTLDGRAQIADLADNSSELLHLLRCHANTSRTKQPQVGSSPVVRAQTAPECALPSFRFLGNELDELADIDGYAVVLRDGLVVTGRSARMRLGREATPPVMREVDGFVFL